MSRFLCAFAVATTAIVGSTHAATILTFADPATGPSTPLFTFNGTTLSGGWSGNGLLLETPGLAAPNFPDAHFVMAAVTVTPSGFPPFYNLGPGQIDFLDSSDNFLARITFSGGLLTDGLGFGSNVLAGFNVQFVPGGIIPAGTPGNQAFSFSFANQVGTSTNYTATASFTSSADNIPAPASVALLGLGIFFVARRHR